ncbi:MAG: helix-turn-helix transcriptional regulator [Clostridiales bacterium]|nr:helix-turn-helix transcriptional regulator [Clostridiales bacterium]
MGVTASTISMYERDIAHPKLETVQRFAAALECSVSDLIDLDTDTPATGEDVAQIAATQDTNPVERIDAAVEQLNYSGQTVAADLVEGVAAVPKYRKDKGHSSEG